MKKITAVEWLAHQVSTVKWKTSDITDRNKIIEEAMKMERDQICDAYFDGKMDMAEGINNLSLEYYKNNYYKNTNQ